VHQTTLVSRAFDDAGAPAERKMTSSKSTLSAWLALSTSVCLIAACSTPYQPFTLTGGYKDRQLAPGLYAVEFKGNGKTSSDLVLDMYLYRCAELTVQNHFDLFVSRKPDASPETARADSLRLLADAEPGGLRDFRSVGVSYMPITVPGQTITSYSISGHVRMGRYTDVPSTAEAWDARLVMKTLEPIVKGGHQPAMKQDEVASLTLVNGRGSPVTNAPSATLDDLRGLFGQP
jgi:hypothetical protein